VRHTPRARKSAASPLTGRLFDESGLSLTPSHAVKGQRRYRYYVSRNLIKGTADSTGRGWRLPAPEIEQTVATAVGQMLNDRTEIANPRMRPVLPRIGFQQSSPRQKHAELAFNRSSKREQL
jgi:hypothetical protein